MKFEIMPARIENCDYQMNFVQCAACGTVVGVLEGNNLTAVLESQAKQLKKIAQKVGAG